jgi:hypothetical protein
MSVVKNLLLAVGGAAIVATGLATSASAQVVAAGPGACEAYASEYAAVNAPQFGLFGWNAAYRHAYNECIAGGPDFASAYAIMAIAMAIAMAMQARSPRSARPSPHRCTSAPTWPAPPSMRGRR